MKKKTIKEQADFDRRLKAYKEEMMQGQRLREAESRLIELGMIKGRTIGL